MPHQRISTLTLILLAAAACSGGPTPPTTNQYVRAGTAVCLPASASSSSGTSAGAAVGTSTALVAWGGLNTPATSTAAAGAPSASAGGAVRLTQISSDGLLTSVTQSLSQPTGSSEDHFGWALLAADVRAYHPDNLGTGQELIVGAPGDVTEASSTKGAIFWYEVAASTGTWQLGGSYAPTGLAAGAKFGASLAQQSPHPGAPAWIAVGAPGAKKVYILSVSPTMAAPIATTPLQVLALSPAAATFGYTVTSGDFDGDHIADLAVAAPDRVGGGRVFVYRGASGAVPFPYPPVFVEWDATDDDFGAAMAAGAVYGSDLGRDLLIIGAPGRDRSTGVDFGGVCQFRFESSPTTTEKIAVAKHTCFENPWALSAPNDRLGAAVAVGDYVPVDGNGASTGSWADVREVAVGAPGGGGNQGHVLLWGTDADGMTGYVHGPLYQYPVAAAGAKFGASLAAGYAQRDASNLTADLLVGAPGHDAGRGGVTLTKGSLAGYYNITGVWRGPDSEGTYVNIKVTDNGDNALIKFINADFIMSVVHAGTTSPCVLPGGDDHINTPRGTETTIDWDRTAGSFTDTETGTTYTVTAPNKLTINVDETSALFTSFLDADCTIPGNPFVFQRVSGSECD